MKGPNGTYETISEQCKAVKTSTSDHKHHWSLSLEVFSWKTWPSVFRESGSRQGWCLVCMTAQQAAPKLSGWTWQCLLPCASMPWLATAGQVLPWRLLCKCSQRRARLGSLGLHGPPLLDGSLTQVPAPASWAPWSLWGLSPMWLLAHPPGPPRWLEFLTTCWFQGSLTLHGSCPPKAGSGGFQARQGLWKGRCHVHHTPLVKAGMGLKGAQNETPPSDAGRASSRFGKFMCWTKMWLQPTLDYTVCPHLLCCYHYWSCCHSPEESLLDQKDVRECRKHIKP